MTLLPLEPSHSASYYNWSFHWICLRANSSAVFRSRGTKFGKEVGGGHGKSIGLLVSMETNLFWLKIGYSLTVQPFNRWCWIFACEVFWGIGICLQKMNKIYQGPEVAHSKLLKPCGPNAKRHLLLLHGYQLLDNGCTNDVLRARVTLRVTSLTSDRSGSKSWGCQILNF